MLSRLPNIWRQERPEPMGRTLLLRLAYEGTRFSGWQAQPGRRTVQGVLAEAITAVSGESLLPKGASRTDAGVHAVDQVVGFTTTKDHEPDVWRRALNANLPEDVVVLTAQEAPVSFDPVGAAVSKRYRYRIHDATNRPVLARRFVWRWKSLLDAVAMQRAASHLIGEHDFSSFENPSSPRLSKVRRITSLEIGRRQGADGTNDAEVWIEVEGNGFLYNMVRIIAGTLVMVGCGKRSSDWLAEVVAGRRRALAGPTAPPQGLSLIRIDLDTRSTEFKHVPPT
jgi:tRNA pseudouridine38-40 synthase